MLSDKAIRTCNAIRNDLRIRGITNRHVNIICKEYKENNKKYEVIYIINQSYQVDELLLQEIFQFYSCRYTTEKLRFMYQSMVNAYC